MIQVESRFVKEDCQEVVGLLMAEGILWMKWEERSNKLAGREGGDRKLGLIRPACQCSIQREKERRMGGDACG